MESFAFAFAVLFGFKGQHFLRFGGEKNLTSEKAGKAQDVSPNWSKDYVAGKNGRLHSRESKVEVRRTRHGCLIGLINYNNMKV